MTKSVLTPSCPTGTDAIANGIPPTIAHFTQPFGMATNDSNSSSSKKMVSRAVGPGPSTSDNILSTAKNCVVAVVVGALAGQMVGKLRSSIPYEPPIKHRSVTPNIPSSDLPTPQAPRMTATERKRFPMTAVLPRGPTHGGKNSLMETPYTWDSRPSAAMRTSRTQT